MTITKTHFIAFFLGLLIMLVANVAFMGYILEEKAKEPHGGPLLAGVVMFLAILGIVGGLLFNPINKEK